MSSKEAAAYLGISLWYLQNMRNGLHNHEGPAYIVAKRPPKSRGGTACYYTKEALDAWSKAHKWRIKSI